MAEKVDIKPETKIILKRPKLYCVVFYNDDYTTMEFVVEVIKKVFHKTEAEANGIMMNVHKNGKGTCGVYTYDIAITKAVLAQEMAKEREFPLKITVEEE